jgi:hypothetical protein
MNKQQQETDTLHRLAIRLEAISNIDLLCDDLEALSRMKSAQMVRATGAQDPSHHLLEEASAAHSQVITLLDTLYQELAYYRQYFQESQEQRTSERSR